MKNVEKKNSKHPYEVKYQLLINKRETAGLKHFNDCKAFIEYSNDMDDVYKNIEEYNLNKKRKILFVFDDVINYMLNKKRFDPVATELFIRGRKLKTSFVFIIQSYFAVLKNVRLDLTYHFTMEIPSKRKLQ